MAVADSCDMFVALPPATKDCIIFGKNSDRPASEVQEVVYSSAGDHGTGAKVQCTYLEIDQVSHTHAVILSKPAWMWGAEMGANEHGVVIGNEAVWTKEGSDLDLEEKLLGMDLVRLGLERGGTAREAMDVMTSLLASHGQGGPCYEDPEKQNVAYHNSFLIADRSEAWMLETAGQHWAAVKVTGGTENMSNLLSIGSGITESSEGLKDHAKSKGFWDGNGDFDFAKAFNAPPKGAVEGVEHPESRYKAGKQLLADLSAGGNFTAQSMMEVLRYEEGGICRVGKVGSATMGSMVSVLYPTASGKLSCHWFTATPNPKCSVFKPFIFAPDVSIGTLTVSPTFQEDPAKMKPRFKSQVDRQHTLYKRHEVLKPLPGDATNTEVLNTLKAMETQSIEELECFVNENSQDRMEELNELFKDIVESEIKFYHIKK